MWRLDRSLGGKKKINSLKSHIEYVFAQKQTEQIFTFKSTCFGQTLTVQNKDIKQKKKYT